MRAELAKPACRLLRVYAFDPRLLGPLHRAIENEVSLKVPWEALGPGPIGEYVEVIDYDPPSRSFYAPVDLDSPPLLAQNGLPPAEGIPQFHQQMVYALVMTTVRRFEEALGRVVLWPPHVDHGQERFVRRLRVYPHALRDANAYYSPSKAALLLGYFPTETVTAGNTMSTTVFTCLSHALVAHETTHAVLDGLRRLATLESEGLIFQEGFADLVGLLQHFAFPGFLRSQITFTADLEANERQFEDLASRLAQPGGRAAELRQCIGVRKAASTPATGFVSAYGRAAVLVAAVFNTFLAVFRRRSAALLRLSRATVAAQPELNGDLLDALSAEAVRSASHVVRMCIRAIDYCPPVDVTFDDFLRAVVTADTDLAPEDERGYRVTVVEACRQFGIYPPGIPSVSPLRLLWPPPEMDLVVGSTADLDLAPALTRQDEFLRARRRCVQLAIWLRSVTAEAAREMGLALGDKAPQTIARRDGSPLVTVRSARFARRTGPKGHQVADWVITISQERRGYFDPDTQRAQDGGGKQQEPDFIFSGGCTLLVEPGSRRARFCFAKDILSEERLARHREFLQERMGGSAGTEDNPPERPSEPFSALRVG